MEVFQYPGTVTNLPCMLSNGKAYLRVIFERYAFLPCSLWSVFLDLKVQCELETNFIIPDRNVFCSPDFQRNRTVAKEAALSGAHNKQSGKARLPTREGNFDSMRSEMVWKKYTSNLMTSLIHASASLRKP